MIRGAGRFLFAVLTAYMLFASVVYADSFRLRLEDFATGTGVVLTDNGAGDWNPLAGAITYLGSINDFIINVTTGISKPAIGGVNNYAELDLNSVNVQFTGAGTLRSHSAPFSALLKPFSKSPQ